jgi:hypothetical protein
MFGLYLSRKLKDARDMLLEWFYLPLPQAPFQYR